MPRDNADTTGAAARERSTACHTGSTPGSPGQLSPKLHALNQVCPGSFRNKTAIKLSTISTALSTRLQLQSRDPHLVPAPAATTAISTNPSEALVLWGQIFHCLHQRL